MALFIYILFITITLINTEQFIEEKCQYRSEKELKLHFQQEIEKYFYMISIGINHNPEMEFLFSNSILNNPNIVHKDRKCSIIGNYELCPHTQLNFTRNDRFPFKVSYSVCNCDKCNFFNGHCVPVTITRPVLYRTFCDSDNYWEWKYGFEKIPVQCICVKN